MDADTARLRRDLNGAVVAFMQSADRLEHRLNVAMAVFGALQLAIFVTELLILRKVGL